MTQSTKSSQDILLQKYQEISLDYSYRCEQMRVHLEKFQKAGDGDSESSLSLKLSEAAKESERLATEISNLLSFAKETGDLAWQLENVNNGIGKFIELSEKYLDMREGFIELLMDNRSPVRKKSEVTEIDGELEERDKENLIMRYMKGERKIGREPKWSNTKIGKFFGLEANSVVNRLNKE